MTDLYEYENILHSRGHELIAGVDEAGRGPLAGSVFAAAVIMPEGVHIDGVNDSKKLSEKTREKLFDEIIRLAVSYSITSVDAAKIDEINILNATLLAMKQAIDSLNPAPDYVLIDGNQKKGIDLPCECVVKGDSSCFSIAAASILAKVARDRYMKELALQYPRYNFGQHKGYGTSEHIDLIKIYGPSDIHRMTFLKNII